MGLMKIMNKVNIPFIPIQEWVAQPEDIIFQQSKGYIIAPVSKYFGAEASALDYYSVASKKAYNSSLIRSQCVHYLNYFEKFYDLDRELFTFYARTKYLIDCTPGYSKDAFFYDLRTNIFRGMIMQKITKFNKDNYCLDIKFVSRDANLYYNNDHVYSMLKMSTIMILIIPLLTHFAKQNKIANIDDYLMEIYYEIMDLFSDKFDLFNKLYESSITNIEKNKKSNPIWEKQDIRKINATTHALETVEKIIMNVMPKYIYSPDANPVMLNYASIKSSIIYKITDVGYELDYVPLSSSNRDEENNSELDRYASHLMKQDEALYLQNKVNCRYTMKQLEASYGAVSKEEIAFYEKRLTQDGGQILMSFQKELIFNMFYKYFGDSTSINSINKEDYIKLIVIARRISLQEGQVILPWIFSSRLVKYNERKSLNKNEIVMLESSPYYQEFVNKYCNEKVKKILEGMIATILSSKFEIIDPSGEYDGVEIPSIYKLIGEEVLYYATYLV